MYWKFRVLIPSSHCNILCCLWTVAVCGASTAFSSGTSLCNHHHNQHHNSPIHHHTTATNTVTSTYHQHYYSYKYPHKSRLSCIVAFSFKSHESIAVLLPMLPIRTISTNSLNTASTTTITTNYTTASISYCFSFLTHPYSVINKPLILTYWVMMNCVFISFFVVSCLIIQSL